MEGYSYKKAGVIVSDIRSKTGSQRDMFDSTDRDKHARLMKAMDGLNAPCGRHKVVTAAAGYEFFKMNRKHLSQKFTTDWGQIIRVKAKCTLFFITLGRILHNPVCPALSGRTHYGPESDFFDQAQEI